MNHIYYQHFQSPIGLVEVGASDQALGSVFFVEQPRQSNANHHTELAVQQLREYFDGLRLEFDLPTEAPGTDFQQHVWRQLGHIPYGDTCSYADIALRLNNPKAVRAVGAANGKNPLSIVVPCHRVIAANGSLSGYVGGVDRKQWLLDHERAIKSNQSS